MKIAVLSDIHANQPALEAVIADYRQVDFAIDKVWFLGDLFGYCTRPVQVYGKLNGEERLKDGIWLAGNHDLMIGQVEDERLWANEVALHAIKRHQTQLPEDFIQDVNNKPTIIPEKKVGNIRFTIAHGFPEEDYIEAAIVYDRDRAPQNKNANGSILDRERLDFPETSVWIVGHSHYQTAWHYNNDTQSWQELIEGFGQSLSGEARKLLPDVTKGAFGVQFEYKTNEKDFIVLNPGSVGISRDGICDVSGAHHIAKYMILEVDNSIIRGEFRMVQYSAQTVLDEWEDLNYEPLNEFTKYFNC